jgi:hypothetical protein
MEKNINIEGELFLLCHLGGGFTIEKKIIGLTVKKLFKFFLR